MVRGWRDRGISGRGRRAIGMGMYSTICGGLVRGRGRQGEERGEWDRTKGTLGRGIRGGGGGRGHCLVFTYKISKDFLRRVRDYY